MKRKIFIARDYDKGEYVWALNPQELKAKSPNWGKAYREIWVSEQQFHDLQNGGWIAAVKGTGVRSAKGTSIRVKSA